MSLDVNMSNNSILETTTPGKIHKSASLPIARNSGSGYERQERARTSHACEPCRERKTKCDGERPSCHRCQHTGTGCHYGYGKGWRKRKTAEDLTATSRKLQIYESLLSNIYPRVDNDIQAQIDEARNQDVMTLGTPESMETTSSAHSTLPPSAERERSMSGASSRLPLPPPNILSPQARPPPLSAMSFERVSEAPSPHLAHHPKREGLYDDVGGNRLPSITPQGLLIESSIRDPSPGFHATGPPQGPGLSARPGRFSPTSMSSQSASLPRPPSR